MNLESRDRYASSEDFRDDFIGTLTPGIIPRANFIQWKTIEEKRKKYERYFEFFRELPHSSDTELRNHLRDSLFADDDPLPLVTAAFQLLGHTGKTYASVEDFVDFKKLGKDEKTVESMEYVANLLLALGIKNVLECNLDDYFLGVQIGLESHRRKNVGGTAFVASVRTELEKIIKSLNFKGQPWELSEEKKIIYIDGVTSKKVDFLLQKDGKKIGVEVNFYTAPGSKPTEIKRSYGQVNRDLDAVGASLIWITDGAGYLSMKNSLKEARDIHQNIYNFQMLKTYLEPDLELLP
ncbi:MAG TPA: DpnII family type II restriction endonuclease [Candidatus Paceibacterota bacterium]|jgi:hypothetical protein